MTKIHLDTDLGGDPDDLCALTMLLKWSDLQITGISRQKSWIHKICFELAGREDIL